MRIFHLDLYHFLLGLGLAVFGFVTAILILLSVLRTAIEVKKESRLLPSEVVTIISVLLFIIPGLFALVTTVLNVVGLYKVSPQTDHSIGNVILPVFFCSVPLFLLSLIMLKHETSNMPEEVTASKDDPPPA